MSTPAITLVMQGATLEQAQHYQELIHTLFAQGVFSVRNGRATIHFDDAGKIQQIEMNFTRFRHNKPYQSPPAVQMPKMEITA